jgi:hypothetical protein
MEADVVFPVGYVLEDEPEQPVEEILTCVEVSYLTA